MGRVSPFGNFTLHGLVYVRGGKALLRGAAAMKLDLYGEFSEIIRLALKLLNGVVLS